MDKPSRKRGKRHKCLQGWRVDHAAMDALAREVAAQGRLTQLITLYVQHPIAPVTPGIWWHNKDPREIAETLISRGSVDLNAENLDLECLQGIAYRAHIPLRDAALQFLATLERPAKAGGTSDIPSHESPDGTAEAGAHGGAQEKLKRKSDWVGAEVIVSEDGVRKRFKSEKGYGRPVDFGKIGLDEAQAATIRTFATPAFRSGIPHQGKNQYVKASRLNNTLNAFYKTTGQFVRVKGDKWLCNAFVHEYETDMIFKKDREVSLDGHFGSHDMGHNENEEERDD